MQLEQFIQKNREAFDDEMPRLQVWSNIEQALDKPRGKLVPLWPVMRILRLAAAAALLLSAGMGLGIWIARPTDGGAVALKDISPEYAELTSYYEGEIQRKTQQLVTLKADPAVNQDLSQMATFMADLQKELADAPPGSEEEIINAMITNYRTRLEILDRVLDRIQNTSNSQNLQQNESENI